MIDFKSALAAGLDMAEQIQLNKKEIDDKLMQIAVMLHEGTDKRVILLFNENTKHTEAIFGNQVQNVQVASSRDTGRAAQIATIIMDSENGFPVVLTTHNTKFVCKTVEEIEVAFSELVQIPYIANTIFSIVKGELF